MSFVCPGVSAGWSSVCPSWHPVPGFSQLVSSSNHPHLQRPVGDCSPEERSGLINLHWLGRLRAAPAGWCSDLLHLRGERENPTSVLLLHAVQHKHAVQ